MTGRRRREDGEFMAGIGTPDPITELRNLPAVPVKDARVDAMLANLVQQAVVARNDARPARYDGTITIPAIPVVDPLAHRDHTHTRFITSGPDQHVEPGPGQIVDVRPILERQHPLAVEAGANRTFGESYATHIAQLERIWGAPDTPPPTMTVQSVTVAVWEPRTVDLYVGQREPRRLTQPAGVHPAMQRLRRKQHGCRTERIDTA